MILNRFIIIKDIHFYHEIIHFTSYLHFAGCNFFVQNSKLYFKYSGDAQKHLKD